MPADPKVENRSNGTASGKKPHFLWYLFFCGLGISFVVFYVCATKNTESGWLVLLFALPGLVQLGGLSPVYRRFHADGMALTESFRSFFTMYLVTILICFASHLFLWYRYLNQVQPELQVSASASASAVSTEQSVEWLSHLAILTIAVLLLLVAVITLAILSTRLQTLKQGVSEAPFLAIVLFFTVFLVVSYLFGFAFAFHDRSKLRADKKHALYMRNLDDRVKGIGAGTGTEAKPNDFPGAARANRNSSSFDKPKLDGVFEFDDGEAILAAEVASKDLPTARPDLKPVWDARQRYSAELAKVVEKTRLELKNGVEESRRVRIILIGRADESHLGKARSTYQSNYELAEARARSVQYELMEALFKSETGTANWQNTEWVIVSKSNEQEPIPLAELGGKGRTAARKSNGRRSVEVFIEAVKNEPLALLAQHTQSDGSRMLELIDYVYFANYTITTTGYGDIMPITSYAKFLCAAANICEVFFLVVFFNALLSLRPPPPPPAGDQNAMGTDGQDPPTIGQSRSPGQTQRSVTASLAAKTGDRSESLKQKSRRGQEDVGATKALPEETTPTGGAKVPPEGTALTEGSKRKRAQKTAGQSETSGLKDTKKKRSERRIEAPGQPLVQSEATKLPTDSIVDSALK